MTLPHIAITSGTKECLQVVSAVYSSSHIHLDIIVIYLEKKVTYLKQKTPTCVTVQCSWASTVHSCALQTKPREELLTLLLAVSPACDTQVTHSGESFQWLQTGHFHHFLLGLWEVERKHLYL